MTGTLIRPASSAASQRRSPATISSLTGPEGFGCGRAMIGNMTPTALMLPASSAISFFVKRARRRSWVRVVEGASSTSGTIWKSACAIAPGSAGAFMDLLRGIEDRFGALDKDAQPREFEGLEDHAGVAFLERQLARVVDGENRVAVW